MAQAATKLRPTPFQPPRLLIRSTAQVLEVNRKTVVRDWDFARTWLLRETNLGESAAE